MSDCCDELSQNCQGIDVSQTTVIVNNRPLRLGASLEYILKLICDNKEAISSPTNNVVEVKTGVHTTTAALTDTVTFASPFAGAPLVLVSVTGDPGELVTPFTQNESVGSFDIGAYNAAGGLTSGITIRWFAIQIS